MYFRIVTLGLGMVFPDRLGVLDELAGPIAIWVFALVDQPEGLPAPVVRVLNDLDDSETISWVNPIALDDDIDFRPRVDRCHLNLPLAFAVVKNIEASLAPSRSEP